MKKIIFRVDDRLIHGQVVEGWVKHLHLDKIIIVNDKVSVDSFRQVVYESVVPPKTVVTFYSISDFISNWDTLKDNKHTIVLFESIDDLAKVQILFNEDIYINIGCVSSRCHSLELSNTVFLEQYELDMLVNIAKNWKINVKKLPWDKEEYKL